MPIGIYLLGVGKALAPALWDWAVPKLVGMTITEPRDGASVDDRYVKVRGSYRRELGQRFLCFYQDAPHRFYL